MTATEQADARLKAIEDTLGQILSTLAQLVELQQRNQVPPRTFGDWPEMFGRRRSQEGP